MLEHDFEPAPGLPESLPRNERLLWQGKSNFTSIARWTFHVRKLAAYFAALLVLRLVLQLNAGAGIAAGLAGSIALGVLAAAAIGVLVLYSWLIARSTLFTITSKRIIIRAGVAVPMTVNLPFSRVDAADLRQHADGTGDIAVLMESASRVSYVLLWPYVKPWRFMRVRPVLRGIADAQAVAAILTEALTLSIASDEAAAKEAAKEANRSDVSGPEPKPRRNWLAYPTLPLAAAASLVIFALVGVALLQVGDRDNGATQVTANIIAEVRLTFRDRDDGAVLVVNADSGDLIDVLEPGTNGFLRSTMRTFVRERKAVHLGNETPFALQQTEAGRLLLTDPATGREVDLIAFGKTNAEAFRRFLIPNAQTALVTSANNAVQEPSQPETAVAHATQETTP